MKAPAASRSLRRSRRSKPRSSKKDRPLQRGASELKELYAAEASRSLLHVARPCRAAPSARGEAGGAEKVNDQTGSISIAYRSAVRVGEGGQPPRRVVGDLRSSLSSDQRRAACDQADVADAKPAPHWLSPSIVMARRLRPISWRPFSAAAMMTTTHTKARTPATIRTVLDCLPHPERLEPAKHDRQHGFLPNVEVANQ